MIKTVWQNNYIRGEQVHGAKINPEVVEDIRSAQRQRNSLRAHIRSLSNEALAARYGVTVKTVESVLSGRTWRHV